MRILIIEDYASLRNALVKGLREAGFAVDSTGDGEEGLWYAMGNDYDVIILDLMLPGVDGLTILQKLRKRRQKTHILILTVKGELEDKLKGLELGADDYMVKPFAFEELVARVKALIRRGYGSKNPVIEIGDIRIDTNSRRVWRRESEIHLTAREYAILEYLALRRGEIASRTEIWEHIYDWASDNTSNVVDVYTALLRRKLDRKGEPSIIETVRGRGYSLTGEHDD